MYSGRAPSLRGTRLAYTLFFAFFILKFLICFLIYLSFYNYIYSLAYSTYSCFFWTCTLKKSPLFLDFILNFILLEACIIRIFVLACGLVDFWRSKADILLYAENPVQTYAYAREPTTCILLLYYAILPESFTKTLQKLYNSVFITNITLLRRTTTFFLQFHRILLDYFIFSYTSLSGIITKTHFTPDFTKETPEKSRIDTSLRARALLLYDLLSSLLIRQNKTHLTSNSTPY